MGTWPPAPKCYTEAITPRRVITSTDAFALWVVIFYDASVGLLWLWVGLLKLVSAFSAFTPHPSLALELFQTILQRALRDGLIGTVMLATGMALWVAAACLVGVRRFPREGLWRVASAAQRIGFWCHVLLTALLVLSPILVPTNRGAGDPLMMLPFLLLIAGIGFRAASFVKMLLRQG